MRYSPQGAVSSVPLSLHPTPSVSVRLFNVPLDPEGYAPYTRVNHAKFMVSEQVHCLTAFPAKPQCRPFSFPLAAGAYAC